MAASSFFCIVFLVLQSGHKKMLLLYCNLWQLFVMPVAIVWVWFLLHSFLWSFYFIFIFSFFSHVSPVSSFLCLGWKWHRWSREHHCPWNMPWATQPCSVVSLTPLQPSLLQFSHPSPYNPLTHLRQEASRCAVQMLFLRTIIYFLAEVETLGLIHHNFLFSNFTKIAIITFSQ